MSPSTAAGLGKEPWPVLLPWAMPNSASQADVATERLCQGGCSTLCSLKLGCSHGELKVQLKEQFDPGTCSGGMCGTENSEVHPVCISVASALCFHSLLLLLRRIYLSLQGPAGIVLNNFPMRNLSVFLLQLLGSKRGWEMNTSASLDLSLCCR